MAEYLGTITKVSYPTKSYLYDEDTERVYLSEDNKKLMSQAIDIIIEVERFVYEILTNNAGTQKIDLPGQSLDVIVNVFEKRLENSIKVDDRVKAVRDFEYEKIDKNNVTFKFVVDTIYGTFNKEVTIQI